MNMMWTVLSFGKYAGKTLPQILLLDPDWFFWMLPKFYGQLAEEAQDLARKATAVKIPGPNRKHRLVEYQYEEARDLSVSGSSMPTAQWIANGARDDFISICHGFVAINHMTRAAVVG